ncbi:MAG: hypothetical protein QOD94_2917 [Alphaproteobacteria bacterium]|jgi:hypothetical protein|nr:hypothetical protein [Alphaproteobacteria bacterium]
MFWVVGNTSETQFTDTNEWVFRLSGSLHSLVLGSFNRRSHSDGLPAWRSAWDAWAEGKPSGAIIGPLKAGLRQAREEEKANWRQIREPTVAFAH